LSKTGPHKKGKEISPPKAGNKRTGSRLSGGDLSFSSASPVKRDKADKGGNTHAGKAKSHSGKGKTQSGKGKTRPAKGHSSEGLVRLNKYIAASGICSRREADDLISAGLVSVNGTVVTQMGTKVSQSDDVRYNGERLKNERKVYLLLNKPKDYVTTTDDPKERKTVMLLVAQACSERIYPVGRLDRNTTGVLLFTNDGALAKKLTHPSHNKKKIYHVFLNKGFTAGDMKKLAEGIDLEDGFIQPDAISYASSENKREVGLEIHSGQNRIVRRMFEHLGYRVVKLDRVYYAGLTKKDLPRGKWRFLTEKEVNRLNMNAYE
jgi:23S rRNA pseudouridine2605 synthase